MSACLAASSQLLSVVAGDPAPSSRGTLVDAYGAGTLGVACEGDLSSLTWSKSAAASALERLEASLAEVGLPRAAPGAGDLVVRVRFTQSETSDRFVGGGHAESGVRLQADLSGVLRATNETLWTERFWGETSASRIHGLKVSGSPLPAIQADALKAFAERLALGRVQTHWLKVLAAADAKRMAAAVRQRWKCRSVVPVDLAHVGSISFGPGGTIATIKDDRDAFPEHSMLSTEDGRIERPWEWPAWRYAFSPRGDALGLVVAEGAMSLSAGLARVVSLNPSTRRADLVAKCPTENGFLPSGLGIAGDGSRIALAGQELGSAFSGLQPGPRLYQLAVGAVKRGGAATAVATYEANAWKPIPYPPEAGDGSSWPFIGVARDDSLVLLLNDRRLLGRWGLRGNDRSWLWRRTEGLGARPDVAMAPDATHVLLLAKDPGGLGGDDALVATCERIAVETGETVLRRAFRREEVSSVLRCSVTARTFLARAPDTGELIVLRFAEDASASSPPSRHKLPAPLPGISGSYVDDTRLVLVAPWGEILVYDVDALPSAE